MLEKFSNFFCDAHLHFTVVPDYLREAQNLDFFWKGCSCCHSKQEWENQIKLILPQNVQLLNAFGLHPQAAEFIDIKETVDFLESILRQNSTKKIIHAIGEAGFDYFTESFKNQKKKQEEMFNIQLDLAKEYKIPLIIHSRKSTHKLFEYSKDLKKVPSVLFHSFMGSRVEAESLLKKGINAYFSFGKQIKNNNKKAIDCVSNLPLENLIMETDAPFQFLKNEKYTPISHIKAVYEELMSLRKDINNHQDIILQLEKNFDSLFSLI